MRTYDGHEGAIKDLAISPKDGGKRMMSCGFDKQILVWDVETGQATCSFTQRGAVPTCAKWYPGKDDWEGNRVLSGWSNNRVVEWDMRSGDVVQEYTAYFEAGVSTITFLDDNRRFITTAEDRKTLVWDMGIPTPFKYIQQSGMHMQPAATAHPNGRNLVSQSVNQILTWGLTSKDKFTCNKKRIYKMDNSGSTCEIAISPDGSFVATGDHSGNLHVWDFENMKMRHQIRNAHKGNGGCKSVAWHPSKPATVATCGWDGLIKVWE